MTLFDWGRDWGVPTAALYDLMARMGTYPVDDPTPQVPQPQSEQDVSNLAKIREAQRGGRLWRNNVGACLDSNGNFIRYGLANESKAMNERFKSSDLIGLRPTVVDASMVGTMIGVFVARECKAPGWRYTGTAHERAQSAFLDFVAANGGDARFIC